MAALTDPGARRFRPISPERLAGELADRVVARSAGRVRLGIDGFDAAGAADLADRIAEELVVRGRPAVRAGTRWWWRAAALRLEYGHRDVAMLRDGWVDAAALRRELLDPFGPTGDGRYLTRLRDPATDRSVRQGRATAAGNAVLVLDGPFLVSAALPLDLVALLEMSPAALTRALPADQQWWAAGWAEYLAETDPAGHADAVVSWDHPAAPAVRWSW